MLRQFKVDSVGGCCTEGVSVIYKVAVTQIQTSNTTNYNLIMIISLSFSAEYCSDCSTVSAIRTQIVHRYDSTCRYDSVMVDKLCVTSWRTFVMSQACALGRQILDLTEVLVPLSSEKPPHAHVSLSRCPLSTTLSTFPWSSGPGGTVPQVQIRPSVHVSCNA